MAVQERRAWSERELRDLIQMEVSTGQTMSVFNASIEGGSLNIAVSQIAASAFQGFETQAFQIASQQTTIGSQQDAITSILADCRAFVAQTTTETNTAKAAMAAEVDSLQKKIQDIVRFIAGVSDTTRALALLITDFSTVMLNEERKR